MTYTVIYDGNCNLCTTLVQVLERLDHGDRFHYLPMQDQKIQDYGITSQDCEQGMILLNDTTPAQRWQGSDAAEEIGRLLPLGEVFVNLYRSLPGPKWLGDQIYEQVRDNRYAWFGKRSQTYQSTYPTCKTDTCPTP